MSICNYQTILFLRTAVIIIFPYFLFDPRLSHRPPILKIISKHVITNKLVVYYCRIMFPSSSHVEFFMNEYTLIGWISFVWVFTSQRYGQIICELSVEVSTKQSLFRSFLLIYHRKIKDNKRMNYGDMVT